MAVGDDGSIEGGQAGPSSQRLEAPPASSDQSGLSSASDSAALENFWQAAYSSASPALSDIRSRLSRFPSPPLRVQRVNQLDAELLDQELVGMLLAPLKESLALIKPNLPTSLQPELSLLLKLLLFKLSIFDRGATYGAMLQNLKYRNERAHRGGLQSTSRDQPLSKAQLALYPLFTIFFPYLHTRLESRLTSLSFSSLPSSDPRRVLSNALDTFQRCHALFALINFGIFLGDGRYRSLTDRILGMRLTYAHRTMNRNVSFEFLNRQLVWHAFTEFLLFLLPLVRPKRLFRRLVKMYTHPFILGAWMTVLPRFISRRVGLYRDKSSGNARLDRSYPIGKALGAIGLLSGEPSAKGVGSDEQEKRGKYADLPEGVCAICWEKLESSSGVAGGTGLNLGIPSSDPLDPSSGVLAPNRPGTVRTAHRESGSSGGGQPSTPDGGASSRTRRLNSASFLSGGASSSGLHYADAIAHTPYALLPCRHEYCYYCISEKLLDEEIVDELEGSGGWECLRCGVPGRRAERAVEEVGAGESDDEVDPGEEEVGDAEAAGDESDDALFENE